MRAPLNLCTIALVSALCITPAYGDEGADRKTEASKESIILDPEVVIAAFAKIEERERSCAIEKSLAPDILAILQKYRLPVIIADTSETARSASQFLQIRIDRLETKPTGLSGRSSVMTTVSIAATYTKRGDEPEIKYLDCSVAPDINLLVFHPPSCQRIATCSEQLGKQMVRWLRDERRIPVGAVK